VSLFDSEPTVHLRPDILSLPAYKQGRPAPADAFKLSSNENPYPTPAWVTGAMAAASVSRYPESTSRTVRESIATMWGCDVDEVIVGAGSVSILYQLVQATSVPGDNIVFAWRSFEAYPWIATVAGAESRRIPNLPDHRHDLEAMLDAIDDHTRIVLLCTPNNPTGTAITTDEFESFMSRVPSHVLVILDEAYAEFSHEPEIVCGKKQTGKYPNLVTLRTFSKAYGLAGLRIGYGIGHRDIFAAATSTAIPMVVTEGAQRAALAVLDHATEAMDIVHGICERRDRVWAGLSQQGWDVPKPHGNFVWLPTGDNTAEANDVLEAGGIVARVFAGEGIRVTIGEEASVEPFLAATARIVAANLHRPTVNG
jgi:histidinol-phosphate aminotransferase